MKISTVLGAEFEQAQHGDHLAFFIKCAIEAFAQGSVPMAGIWRLPPLYRSGIRFQREPEHGTGNEDFALPKTCFDQKWGDCDDLCIYRIWELRCAGELATCAAAFIENQIHVRVRRGVGHRPARHSPICQCARCIEDPAIICGAR